MDTNCYGNSIYYTIEYYNVKKRVKESYMKKTIFLVIVLILSISLFACKLTENDADKSSSENAVSHVEENTIENNTEEVTSEEDTIEDPSRNGVITTVELSDHSLTQVGETIAYVPDRLIDLAEEDKVNHKYLGLQTSTISFVPTSITYNDLGQLIVKGIITNLTEVDLGHIRIRELSLYNENGELIASESFGYLYYDNGIIPDLKVENAMEWTFSFPKMMVEIKTDDFDHIKTVIKTTCGATYFHYNN